jgi:hypothetical protein
MVDGWRRLLDSQVTVFAKAEDSNRFLFDKSLTQLEEKERKHPLCSSSSIPLAFSSHLLLVILL